MPSHDTLPPVSRLATTLAAVLLPLAHGPAAAEDSTPARGPSVHALAVTGDLKYGPSLHPLRLHRP